MDTPESNSPWYRRTLRWGQTNLTEIDPTRYDGAWWRSYWKRTHTQGVIVNSGGIVAYYPTSIPNAYRAQYLGSRDLFGEIVAAAREEGLAVLARMDTNRVHSPIFEEHPEWIARNRDGAPYRRGELFVTCVTGGYYREFVPRILREIIDRYHPDGFTDNSYSGLDRRSICYCPSCKAHFRKDAGLDLPPEADWDDSRFRRWVRWGYRKREEIWDLNNRVTREAGGPDCRWIGMVGGNPLEESVRLRDLKSITASTCIIMLDFQRRNASDGFPSNAVAGKLLHDIAGWDMLIPESTAMYQNGGRGDQTFRLAAKPEGEVRLWAFEGFSGGIQPWWHHVGAFHEDRRQYETSPPLFEWHERNARFLIDREPIASVGILWSQENIDYLGRNQPEFEFSFPWRGMINALVRSRIPFMPVHADNIEKRASNIDALVLPNVGVLSDDQCTALLAYLKKGGSVLATGRCGILDSDGEPREANPLDGVLGIRRREGRHGVTNPHLEEWEAFDAQSYLRIERESHSFTGAEELMRGFERTDIIQFGGCLEVVDPVDAAVPLTYIPPFPIYPPELAWMRQLRTSLPALTVRAGAEGGRIAYFPADVDRLYGRFNAFDHYLLLRNALRWTIGGQSPVDIDGPGLVDCHPYRQGNRILIHITNLNNEGAWRAPVSEIVPSGPYRVRVHVSLSRASRALLAVAGRNTECRAVGDWVQFEIEQIHDHELAVLE